jgi:hypothetical protein
MDLDALRKAEELVPKELKMFPGKGSTPGQGALSGMMDHSSSTRDTSHP